MTRSSRFPFLSFLQWQVTACFLFVGRSALLGSYAVAQSLLPFESTMCFFGLAFGLHVFSGVVRSWAGMYWSLQKCGGIHGEWRRVRGWAYRAGIHGRLYECLTAIGNCKAEYMYSCRFLSISAHKLQPPSLSLHMITLPFPFPHALNHPRKAATSTRNPSTKGILPARSSFSTVRCSVVPSRCSNSVPAPTVGSSELLLADRNVWLTLNRAGFFKAALKF